MMARTDGEANEIRDKLYYVEMYLREAVRRFNAEEKMLDAHEKTAIILENSYALDHALDAVERTLNELAIISTTTVPSRHRSSTVHKRTKLEKRLPESEKQSIQDGSVGPYHRRCPAARLFKWALRPFHLRAGWSRSGRRHAHQ
jgi:hypothetical protein